MPTCSTPPTSATSGRFAPRHGSPKSPCPKHRCTIICTRSTQRRAAAVSGRRPITGSLGIRFPTASMWARSAPWRWPRRTPTSSGWEPERTTWRARRTPARVCTSRPMRVPPGSSWAYPNRTTLPVSWCTRPIRTPSGWRRWATCSRTTRSAACFAPATVETPGRRCFTSTTEPAPSIW